MIKLLAVRLCLVSLGVAGAIAQDPVAPVAAPILAGRPEHGLPGAVPGSERWIVHFQARAFDLERFRTAIEGRRPANEVSAIVADLEVQLRTDQAPFVLAVKGLGGRVVRQWWLVNAAAVELPPGQLLALRQLPNVAYVQPDERCEPAIRTTTNSSNHDVDILQAQGHRGLGVTVGVLDTGQDSSVGGAGRPHRVYFPGGNAANTTGGGLGGSRLLINRQVGTIPADDQHGHGTGVASICAGGGWGNAAADEGHASAAGIAGYSLSNFTSGTTDLTTMATAWQTMAADRATFHIVAANMSYSASPDPLDVSQQAIDSAALNADVACCVAAANNGSSTVVSCGATNALSVGAVNANTHTVAAFSSRGPLTGDPQRFYPDIAACGVSVVMALRDNEGGNYTDSGTSMASPQVAGAIAQLRARFPALTALQTKAVLLASCVDLATQNPGLSRNDYGMGLLKNKRAHDLAAAGSLGSGTVTVAAPVQLVPVAVVAGLSYQLAIAWNRQDLQSMAWSNLDIAVLGQGGAVLAQSTTPRNVYEVVRFFASFTGTATLRVTATSIGGGTSQPYAWANAEAAPVPVNGTVAAYGAGCAPLGTSINPDGGTLLPLTQASEFAYDLVAPTTMQIVGFEVFSAATVSMPTATIAAVYGNTAGTIHQTQVAITAVTVGQAPGFYRGNFASPVTVPAGPFWISLDHRNLRTNLSNLAAGTVGGGYQRSTVLSGAWTRSPLTLRPSLRVFGMIPGSAGMPVLLVTGFPRTGSTLSLNLSGAPANTGAFLGIGLSSTSSTLGPLPFSLEPLGGTGCSVLMSADSLVLRIVDSLGTTTSSLPIPNVPAFVSTRLFAQYLVIHPTANTLGMVVTAGSNIFLGN